MRLKPEQSAHFEELTEAAAEVENALDALVNQAKDMLRVMDGRYSATVLLFEGADRISAHPA